LSVTLQRVPYYLRKKKWIARWGWTNKFVYLLLSWNRVYCRINNISKHKTKDDKNCRSRNPCPSRKGFKASHEEYWTCSFEKPISDSLRNNINKWNSKISIFCYVI
jgi:hypothetical protein